MASVTIDSPRLRYSARASRDVDEHATHISSWQQEYDQLSRGRFEGQVRELWLAAPRVQVFHEFTGRQTSQRCLPWPGSVWFGIPDGHSPEPLHFCGQLRAADRQPFVLSARAGDDFVLRTPEDFGIYGVVVDESWLHETWASMDLEGSFVPAGRGASVRAAPLSAHHFGALRHTMEQMLSIGSQANAGNAPQSQALLEPLLQHLLRALAGAGEDPAFAAGVAASRRRLTAVVAARSLLADPHGTVDSVEDLCGRLHLTPRTLRNHFQRVVGESPNDFMRTVRLNACRRSLRAAPASTVQDIAASWGFFHMGRFSHDYKAMFDELPSRTLKLARSMPPHAEPPDHPSA